MNEIEQIFPKPFLRWAGGKKWLVKSIDQLIDNNKINCYHEPFLGGGSVFFSRKPQKAYLSDLNKELITTYQILKASPNELIKELKLFKNTETFYYKIRAKNFDSKVMKAAKFIYLNQTSYNGIYRVNLKGEYNVPYGFRNKDFLNQENLKKASAHLQNTIIFTADFEETKKNIQKGDLVFIDPPYTVSHNLNGFVKYNQKIFSLEDQYRLSRYIDFIKSQDAYYILTNAAHSVIKDIFDKNDRMNILKRNNTIGGLFAQRNKIEEYLFTNLP